MDQSIVHWGLVKWHHVALWTRSLRFESLIPSLKTLHCAVSLFFLALQSFLSGCDPQVVLWSALEQIKKLSQGKIKLWVLIIWTL